MDTAPDDTELPTCWNVKDKSPLLDVLQSVVVKYRGPGDQESKNAASIRANRSIHPGCGAYYFEVTVLNKGRHGYIGVGVCGIKAQTTKLPGCDPCSYGYHGDDGHTFSCSSTGTQYGPGFTTGDVIGCCVNFVDSTCFYTKNGENLGIAFRGMDTSEKLYPCVGLRNQDEELEANFGQKPFRFDIDGFRSELRKKLGKQVDETVTAGAWQSRLNDLVIDYLVHHGYSSTASILARDAGVGLKEPEQSIADRRGVYQLVVDGKLAEAVAAVEKTWPEVFGQHPNLLFRLRCRQFVELVAQQSQSESPDADDRLMTFGRDLQAMVEGPACKSADNERLASEVFSLLAYTDPAGSPVAYLLAPARRVPIARSLNSAILEHLGARRQPVLETVVQQTTVCLESMRKSGVASAAFLSTSQFLAGDAQPTAPSSAA